VLSKWMEAVGPRPSVGGLLVKAVHFALLLGAGRRRHRLRRAASRFAPASGANAELALEILEGRMAVRPVLQGDVSAFVIDM
jgi:hypothetical protein